MSFSKVLITGGAGFIGSHLAEKLVNLGFDVYVYDNLSSGKLENINHLLDKKNFRFVKEDLLQPKNLPKILNDCELVFHLAANPEVKISSTNPEIHFQQNLVSTYNLLECLRKNGNVKTLVFTSSSTVYGEAEIPTPEEYSPLNPISIHGAVKLACEVLISAYTRNYGFKSIIYRLANIVGPRSYHGVVVDFDKKLRKNSEELEILGDGFQKKSYLYVDDCVNAILQGLNTANNGDNVKVFNVGSNDQIDVLTIAKIVVEEMGLKNVKFKPTGGVNGGRGWAGDVKNMLLDISKLKSIGWKPTYNSEKAVRLATKSLIKNF